MSCKMMTYLITEHLCFHVLCREKGFPPPFSYKFINHMQTLLCRKLISALHFSAVFCSYSYTVHIFYKMLSRLTRVFGGNKE